MHPPIPTLHGTPTHITAVELYQRHHGNAAGICARCGDRTPCPVRAFAAWVIKAAGEDPRWYDGRLSPTAPTAELPRHADPRPAPEQDFGYVDADHSGYAVGGRSVRPAPEDLRYERGQ